MKGLPPLTELRAFEAAARHLSFKAAAAELGVTPTAISHQIKLLEGRCGQPLFCRRPRPLSLSPAGLQMYPVLNDSLERMAAAVAGATVGTRDSRLRITGTNAFVARWLVPRLPMWRVLHPFLQLELIGTDEVLNLKTGEVDIAIRYARAPPPEFRSSKLSSDRFLVVASPALVGRSSLDLSPADLGTFPLIGYAWPSTDTDAPTWRRWEIAAREKYALVPPLRDRVSLSFREEPHAIDAVLAGQGIALCSDVIVARELATGSLRQLSDVTLPGYGFHLSYRPDHPMRKAIREFLLWSQAQFEAPLAPSLRESRSDEPAMTGRPSRYG
jgi:LysR family transcriptional regulator, glycine cleavage system transcriptional activator